MPVHGVESIVRRRTSNFVPDGAPADFTIPCMAFTQLISVISLLSADTPNIDSPANIDAAASPVSAWLSPNLSLTRHFWSRAEGSPRQHRGLPQEGSTIGSQIGRRRLLGHPAAQLRMITLYCPISLCESRRPKFWPCTFHRFFASYRRRFFIVVSFPSRF